MKIRQKNSRRGKVIRCATGGLIAALVATGCSFSDIASDGPRNTIRIASGEPVGSLNLWDFLGQFNSLDMVYEPLVSYGEGGAIEPALATSWNTSDNGRTVTFHLRKGVTFHDGTPFDAAAAKFNFDQWVGNDKYSFLGSSKAISAVEAPESHTLVLRLSAAYPQLLQELTTVRPVRFLSPTSAPNGQYSKPVGTGPWKFETSNDASATFVRNDAYWGPKPKLERAEMKVIPDSQTRVSALRSGEVDLIGGAYLAPINTVEANDISRDSSLTLLTKESDASVALTFNQRGLLADRAVREAVSLATDITAINTALYGGPDHAADGYFPSSTPHSGTRVHRTFDPDRASQILDKAGWKLQGNTRVKDGKPLRLELLTISKPEHGVLDGGTAGPALKDALSKIGMDVELTKFDKVPYFDQWRARNYDMVFSTTYGAPYDPVSTVLGSLKSSVPAPVWGSPELDRLVDRAVAESDANKLDAAYQSIYDYLEKEVAFVPLTNPPRRYAVRSSVKGFSISPHELHLDLTGVTIG